MSLLRSLSCKFRIDASEDASYEKEINDLINFSQIDIPKDFLELIKEKTEIEFNVNGIRYIRIWGAGGCIEMNKAYAIQKWIPDSLAIGDDEGGNALLYAVGKNGFGLYIVAFNNLDIEELKYVSGSLSDLFIKEVGINIIENC